MQHYRLIVYCLLLSTAFHFCSGQVGTNLLKESVDTHPKLVKTQGSDKYANIRCGTQDIAGNIWFGTVGEGLYRYDGKAFKQFTLKDGLISNTIWTIMADKSGKLWIGADSGLCTYNGKAFTPVPLVANTTSFFTNISSNNTRAAKMHVWCMLQDRNGMLWFGTSDGVYTYNGTSFNRFPGNISLVNTNNISLKSIQYLFEDKAGNIWFGAGASHAGPESLEGICKYDGKSLTNFKPAGDGWIRYIVEDKGGTIWFGTRHNGNWFYDGKKFMHYTAKIAIGAPLLVDSNGNTWFSGEEDNNGFENKAGFWRYDGKSFTNFSMKDGMGNYSVWTIMEDRQGNIWFGTRNNGLYKYDGKSFTCFSE